MNQDEQIAELEAKIETLQGQVEEYQVEITNLEETISEKSSALNDIYEIAKRA